MNYDDQIRFSGDINVEKIEIIGTKGKVIAVPQTVAIEIFESMFENFTTAKLYLEDNIDILDITPLTGQEIVRIVTGTPSIKDSSKKLVFDFHAYKLSDSSQSGDRTSSYILHCVSTEAYLNNSRKISKSHSGKISDMVDRFIRNTEYGLGSLKVGIIEPSANSLQFISNFWTPTQSISFLTDYAMSMDGSPSYVFFENRNGFNFVTLDTLYQLEPIQHFTKNNFVRGGQGVKSVEENYRNILDIQTNDLFDFHLMLSSGALGSTLHTYDMTFKLHETIEFNPVIHEKKYIMLNKNFPFSRDITNPAFLHLNELSQYGMYPNNASSENVTQRRKFMMNMATYHSIQITVPGRTDYTVGKTVHLDLPKNVAINKEDSSDEIRNEVLSGKYLVAEINHAINGKEHKTIMTLIKNSMGR